MGFDLSAIACFIIAACVVAFLPGRWRGWALLIGASAAVYLLQPRLPIRFSDFILPTAALAFTVMAWWWTRAPDQRLQPEDGIAALLIIAVILSLSINRALPPEARFMPARPPELLALVVGILVCLLIGAALWGIMRGQAVAERMGGLIALLTLIFIVLKTEPWARALSGAWRGATGQDVALASALDLNWLGFSYLAFRLIHTLIDRRTGVLPALTLREYVTYALFPPAWVAGPIDRAERFAADLRALPTMRAWDADRFARGGARIAMGVFKKFVIADLLAVGVSLNSITAEQATTPLGMWALVYGYAFRLFFDFSGYSDIAIGIGMLVGVQLPENFARPYLKSTITSFWQSWHKSLGAWARIYVFMPLTRGLLRRQRKPSAAVIVGIGHLATMTLIGLWHGVTVSFLIWGVWHALGLYAHKQWSDRTRVWVRGVQARPVRRRAWALWGWFLTFHFVALGWVWFALPDPAQSLRVIGRLFGVGW